MTLYCLVTKPIEGPALNQLLLGCMHCLQQSSHAFSLTTGFQQCTRFSKCVFIFSFTVPIYTRLGVCYIIYSHIWLIIRNIDFEKLYLTYIHTLFSLLAIYIFALFCFLCVSSWLIKTNFWSKANQIPVNFDIKKSLHFGVFDKL